MTQRYKLIAFDIDGTILNAHYQVCSRLKKIVQRLKQNGYIFTIVSARFPHSALSIAKDLGLELHEAIITLNGGFITNGLSEVIFSNTFQSISVNEHLNMINKNIAVSYYNGFTWVVDKYNKYVNSEINIINWMPQKFDISNIAHVNKICLMGDNEHLIDAQKTLQSIDDSLLVAFSHPNYLELATKDISKYSGLMKYAQKLDIKANEIIAFGDGENDIPMLSNVGLGVAMDNASAHVKKIAKDIASHHMEEGVAIYLEELIAKGVL